MEPDIGTVIFLRHVKGQIFKTLETSGGEIGSVGRSCEIRDRSCYFNPFKLSRMAMIVCLEMVVCLARRCEGAREDFWARHVRKEQIYYVILRVRFGNWLIRFSLLFIV